VAARQQDEERGSQQAQGTEGAVVPPPLRIKRLADAKDELDLLRRRLRPSSGGGGKAAA
jgi:hypothetical protein